MPREEGRGRGSGVTRPHHGRGREGALRRDIAFDHGFEEQAALLGDAAPGLVVEDLLGLRVQRCGCVSNPPTARSSEESKRVCGLSRLVRKAGGAAGSVDRDQVEPLRMALSVVLRSSRAMGQPSGKCR